MTQIARLEHDGSVYFLLVVRFGHRVAAKRMSTARAEAQTQAPCTRSDIDTGTDTGTVSVNAAARGATHSPNIFMQIGYEVPARTR